jgi:type IV pilus assembly protein PilY1
VGLGGGYDQALLRGRAIYMVDVWNGQPVFRYTASDSSGATDPRSKLFAVAAPLSLVDSDSDGLFDLAVAADVGGQVWTLNMSSPGTVGAGTTYNNWFGARSFIQFKGLPFWHRSPFFQRPVVALLPSGSVRVFVGSGDRDQIKDPNGGTCGLANLSACLRKNCSVDVTGSKYEIGSSGSDHFYQGHYTYTAGNPEPTQTLTADTVGASAQCSETLGVTLNFNITCGATTATFQSLASCDWGTPECPVSDGRPIGTQVPYTPAVTMEPSRFYSFLLFDSGSRVQFTTQAGATTYDTNALTDTDLVNATPPAVATASGNGWYLPQNNSIDEKTSSAALMLAGCALWNTLVPNPVSAVTCGASASLPLDTAYSYQADAITGAIGCGMAGSQTYTATVRSTSRTTYVAPQQPALVISVNSLGQVAYGGVSIEPGAAPLNITTATGNVNGGTIHWLEVPRKVHDCRHSGINCN